MRGIGDGPRALLVRSSTEASQGVLVAVHDAEPGLEPQSLNRLFDACYTPKPHGLGMGLAISRSLVENHDGSLWATAHPDTGATCQFTLPTGGGNQHD
jgi:C4-dicarboxylate-specific signal transduction histidine kinase